MGVDARLRELTAHKSIDFATFMEVALYDQEDGFYSGSPERASRHGDFVTSPELGDTFAKCIVRAVMDWAAQVGCTRPVRLVDAGGGRGTLATRLRSFSDGAIVTAVVDASIPALQVAASDGHATASTLGDLPWQPDVIVANELLDNLPAQLMSPSGVPYRVARHGNSYVWDLPTPPTTGVGAGGLLSTASPATVGGVGGAAAALPTGVVGGPPPTASPATVGALAAAAPPTGAVGGVAIMPVGVLAWCGELTEAAAAPALAILVDYGADQATLARRADLPVRAYRDHRRVDPLNDPGTADITCDVPLDVISDRLAELGWDVRRTDQAIWLRRCGIDSIAVAARAADLEAAQRRDSMAQLRAKHVRTEISALTDPTGLGAFGVLTCTR